MCALSNQGLLWLCSVYAPLSEWSWENHYQYHQLNENAQHSFFFLPQVTFIGLSFSLEVGSQIYKKSASIKLRRPLISYCIEIGLFQLAWYTGCTALAVQQDVLINTKYHVKTNATYSCHLSGKFRSRSSHMSRILKIVCYYAVIISHYGKLPCKHGGKRCSLIWQKCSPSN